MSKTKENVKSYQWKKGDNFGKVVVVDTVDDKFTQFTDGSKIFNNVLSEFLTEVIDGEMPFPGVDTINKSNTIEPVQRDTTPVAIKTNKVTTPQIHYLNELVQKLSSKNTELLDVKLGINIPKKSIFDMLIENSDEDREELIKVVVETATEQIEINKLQDYLREEIKNYVKTYYNEKLTS